MAKNYIKLYFDDLDAFSGLTAGEVGRLVTALLEYARDGKEAVLSGSERILYPMMKLRVDREGAAYQKIAETRAEAGRQGGRPKAEGKQNKANESKKKHLLFEKANESKKSNTIANSQAIANSQDNSRETPYNPPQDAFADFAREDEELLEALRGYEEMRKKIKKPMTDRAKQLAVSQLALHTRDKQISMLNESIQNSWAGLFDHSDRDKKPANMKLPEKYTGGDFFDA